MERQRDAAEAQSGYMRDGLTETRNSITEATKSTKAMESIATSMKINADAVAESIAVSRTIRDTNQAAFHAAHRGEIEIIPIYFDGFRDSGSVITN